MLFKHRLFFLPIKKSIFKKKNLSINKILIYLLLIISTISAQITYAQDPCYKHITDELGLPSMTVYQVHQDRAGYIWLGTENGLCRYNGNTFKYYQNELLKDQEILTIKEDTTGMIWFCNFSGQLCYIEDDQIKIHELIAPDHYVSINKRIYIDKNNTFWIPIKVRYANKNTYRLYKYNPQDSIQNYLYSNHSGGNFDMIQSENGQHIYSSASKADSIYHHVYYAKFSVNTNQIEPIDLKVNSNFQHYTGDLQNDSILLYDRYHSYCYDVKNELTFPLMQSPEGEIINIKFVEDDIAVLTKKGLYLLDKKTKKTKRILFAGKSISNVVKDKEGNYWISTLGDVLFFVRNIHSHYYSTSNSQLSDNAVYSIHKDQQNNQLIIGKKDDQLSLLDLQSKAFKNLKLPIGGRINLISSIGNKYVVGGDAGMALVDLNTRKRTVKRKATIKSILNENDEYIWLGFTEGSLRIPKSTVLLENRFKDSRSKYYQPFLINCLAEDAKNQKLWLGSVQGLYYQKQDSVHFYLDSKITENLNIVGLAIDANQNLWLSTLNNGIYGIKDNLTHTHLHQDNLMLSNNCKQLIVDAKNKLWISTNKGVHVYDINAEKISIIDTNDGLPSNEVYALYLDQKDAWIGTNKGLVKYPIDTEKNNLVKPQVKITSISINEKDTTNQDTYDLKYFQNTIAVNLEGLSYKTNKQLDFAYQMFGIDSTWTKTKSDLLRFPSLSPDNYTLKIIALNEDNLASEHIQTIHFNINKKWWTTWWFFGLLALLSTGLFLFIYRRSINRIEQQRALENKVNELRMSALQTQMNPHFIFNALNAVQQYVTTNDTKAALIQISKFSKLIRIIFEQSKESFIKLDEEIKFLHLYLDFEKLRFEDKVKIHLNIDEEVEDISGRYKIPPLLIQPMIENAFKHGLFHKEGGGNLWISMKLKDELLECTIEDDGIGRAKTKAINIANQKQNLSTGIHTTKERIQILNDTKNEEDTPQKSLNIIDLINEEGKPSGTKVIIRI